MSASNSNKRRRKLKRAEVDADPEFQVAPMVDVLLVLLLFFMAITSTEVLKKVRDLELAHAKDAKEDKSSKHEHEEIVNVTWNKVQGVAGISMDQIAYAAAGDLTGPLQLRVRRDPKTYVILRADKDVEFSNVSDIMKACSAAGVGTISFACIIGGTAKDQGVAPAAANP